VKNTWQINFLPLFPLSKTTKVKNIAMIVRSEVVIYGWEDTPTTGRRRMLDGRI